LTTKLRWILSFIHAEVYFVDDVNLVKSNFLQWSLLNRITWCPHAFSSITTMLFINLCRWPYL